MNRNSISRYLNLLVITGHIEMKSYGASKIFFPSQRVPISSFLSFTTDFIVVMDRDYRITQINDHFVDSLGIDRENLIGRDIGEVVLPPLTSLEIPEVLDEVFLKGEISREVSSRKDDSDVYYRINLIPTVFDDGDQGITIQIEDITERKRAESVRALLASIVENSDDAILGKTLEGVLFGWNKAAEKLYGYTAEEAIGQPITIVIPPDLQFEMDWINGLIREGKGLSMHPTQRIRKDGTLIDVSITVSPVKNEAGEIIGASTIARDLTEWKQAERESIIKESALESSVNAIGIASLEGEIIFVNRAFLQMWGYADAEAVLGKNLDDISHGDSNIRDTLSTILSLVRASGQWIGEIRTRRGDGSCFDVQISASLTRAPDGTPLCIMAILLDISERKAAEQKIIETTHRLQNIIEFLPDPTFIIDDEKKVIAWNRALEEMTGVKKEDIIGRSDYAYALPFYGTPRPILIDLVDATERELVSSYSNIHRVGDSLFAEAFVPELNGGRGAYLWGKASVLL
ncbi:MAG TPA: PAS domain S-box protein, partial [Methanomicrobiales archaeon]|nr:PAS domain S-box protein [Methanomicrobiales archaeon]